MKILTKALADNIYKESPTSKSTLLGVFRTVNVGEGGEIFLPGLLFMTVAFDSKSEILQKTIRIYLKNEKGDEIREFYNKKFDQELEELNFIIELAKNKEGESLPLKISPGKYIFFLNIEGENEEWITEFIAN